MVLQIRTAEPKDARLLAEHDRHIAERELLDCIQRGMVDCLEQDGIFIGWMRYGLFWDSIPFLNMMFLLEPYRRKGYGREALLAWEVKQARRGFLQVMTSTAAKEPAQHFYRKLGYRDAGGFFPLGEPYELLLVKELAVC